MKTRFTLRVVALVLVGLATVGQPGVSADKAKVVEVYGVGFRITTNLVMTDTVISNCGDSDTSTDVINREMTSDVAYTGILSGTGRTLNKTILDRCFAGLNHTTFRSLDTFDSLTVAGRTGGAVVELVGQGRIVPVAGTPPTATFNETRIRILCGTGDLKDIHAEGTLTASVRGTTQSRALQLWVHFGHHHDFGYDFLCNGKDE
jgi:hypothetical protein